VTAAVLPTAATPPAAPPRPRPDLLAHPSPTTGRFLLLIGALLSAGLLVGNMAHNALLGRSWNRAILACFNEAQAAVPLVVDLDTQIAYQEVLNECMAPAELTRALTGVGGAAAIAVLALGVVVVIPVWLRRRYRLRPAGERLAGAVTRVAELAAETGLRRPPRLLVGPAGQRDAFVFGPPGMYRIVLPTALVVRWRNAELFDPVVRHELAHVRRHDVPLAWLATAVWVAAAPMLLLPVVLDLVRLDLSLLVPYLWRAAVVLAVVWLIRRQALRSREHDADLHAARQGGDWRPVAAILDTSRPVPRLWRRLISYHPTNAQRVRALADPGRLRGVSLVDGLAAAFLTGVLLPPVLNVLQVAFTGSSLYSWAPHLSAALVGPVAGLAVGVGLWRQALIDHVTGARTWPGGVLLGVVVGLVVGQTIQLDNLGVGGGLPVTDMWVGAAVGAAAVLLSAGTGWLWADASARVPGGRRSWWLGVLVNALIFGIALWALQWMPVQIEALKATGLAGGDAAIYFGRLVGPVVYLAAVPVLVSVAALLWRRADRPLPAWLVEAPTPGPALDWTWAAARRPGLLAVLLAGAVPGLFGAMATLVHRLTVGAPTDDADRVNRYLIWLTVGTLVALTVSFVTVVVVPRSGAALGLVTGVTAAAVAALGMTALNTFVVGSVFEPAFWWSTIVAITALWMVGYVFLLPITLAVWPAPWRDVPGLAFAFAVGGAGSFMAFVAALVLVI
jgi:Zn-dependent protease with chaperone function